MKALLVSLLMLVAVGVRADTYIGGTATNDDAQPGNIGEYIRAQVLAANAISLATNTGKTVTSISLTPGDWDVTGAVVFIPAAGTTMTNITATISEVNNSNPSTDGPIQSLAGAMTMGRKNTIAVPTTRVSLAATTTIYLIAYAEFSGSTQAASGWVAARRMR